MPRHTRHGHKRGLERSTKECGWENEADAAEAGSEEEESKGKARNETEHVAKKTPRLTTDDDGRRA